MLVLSYLSICPSARDNSEMANWICTKVDFGYFYWNLSIHFNIF